MPTRGREMDVGFARASGVRRGSTHDEPGRVAPAPAIEHARPEHRLRRRDVVADSEDGVAFVDISVGAGLAVRAEALLEPAAAVAVQSRVLPSMCGVPMPALPINAERVVLLQEELTESVVSVH